MARMISQPYTDWAVNRFAEWRASVYTAAQAAALVRVFTGLLRWCFAEGGEAGAEPDAAGVGWRDAVDAFVTEERVDRFLGLCLLNSHARGNHAPFAAYLKWLRDNGHHRDAKRLAGPPAWMRAKTAAAAKKIQERLADIAKVDGTALYLVASTMNHSCDPNIGFGRSDVFAGTMCARRDIAVGEELQASYIELDGEPGLAVRRDALRKRYGFRCTCARCMREEQEERDRYLQRVYERRPAMAPASTYVRGLYVRRQAVEHPYPTREL